MSEAEEHGSSSEGGAPDERTATIRAALSSVETPAEAYQVLVETASELAGAAAASVALLDSTAEWVELAASHGYEAAGLSRFKRFQADADIPLAECIRTERSLVLRGRDEILERYEGIRSDSIPPERAPTACLPLSIDTHVVGAFGISFDDAAQPDTLTLEFLHAAATLCTEAVERTVPVTAEGARFRRMVEAARGRLAFVSAATRELS